MVDGSCLLCYACVWLFKSASQTEQWCKVQQGTLSIMLYCKLYDKSLIPCSQEMQLASRITTTWYITTQLIKLLTVPMTTLTQGIYVCLTANEAISYTSLVKISKHSSYLSLSLPNVQKQNGGYDCDLYIYPAYCADTDPTKLIYVATYNIIEIIIFSIA